MSNQVIAWDLELDQLVVITKGYYYVMSEWESGGCDISPPDTFLAIAEDRFHYIGEV